MLKIIIISFSMLFLLFNHCIAEEKKPDTITKPETQKADTEIKPETKKPAETKPTEKATEKAVEKKEESPKEIEKEESEEEKLKSSKVLQNLKRMLSIEDSDLGTEIETTKTETKAPTKTEIKTPAKAPDIPIKPETKSTPSTTTIKPQTAKPEIKPEAKKPDPKNIQTIKPQPPAPKKPETEKPKEEEKPTTYSKTIDFLFGKDPSKTKRPEAKKETGQDGKEPGQDEKREKYQTIIQTTPEIEGTSLQDSIKRAIDNSPEVNKAKIEAELIKRQNTFTPVPTFQVGNDLATGKTMISAGISLPLEPLFTGKQRERYGQLNIEQKKLEVERKVAEQYKNISNLNKKLESKNKKREHAKQLAMNADEQYKGGLIKLDELIKAKELLWTTEYEVESLKFEIEAETERLKSIEKGGK